jgi:hypothetical protein
MGSVNLCDVYLAVNRARKVAGLSAVAERARDRALAEKGAGPRRDMRDTL